MVNQLVLGGPETRMARRLSPAGCVNQMLRMLNPHAHGKRFALQLHADLLQHFEAVARGMTGSQHQMAAGNLRSIGQHQAIELMRLPSAAVAELKACHAAVETHLPARASIRALRPRTTVASLKVPMWGRCSVRISSLAPQATSSSSTLRP